MRAHFARIRTITRRLFGGIQNLVDSRGAPKWEMGQKSEIAGSWKLHQFCSILCSCLTVLIMLSRFFVRNFESGNNSPSRGV